MPVIGWMRRWGPLTAAITVVLAPVLVVGQLLTVLGTKHGATIIDGRLYMSPNAGWPMATIEIAGWVAAIGVGCVFAAGDALGRTVTFRRAIVLVATAAARILVVLLLLAGYSWIALQVVVHVAAAAITSATTLIVALLIVALPAAPMLLAIPAVVLDRRPSQFLSHAYRVVQGRAISAGLIIVTVMIVAPMIAVKLVNHLADAVLSNTSWIAAAMSAVIGTALAIAVAIMQARCLTRAYLWPRPEGDAGPVADRTHIAAMLSAAEPITAGATLPASAADAGTMAVTTRRRKMAPAAVAVAALLTLPAAASATVVSGNVLSLPTVITSTIALHNSIDEIKALAWPRGGHPVFVMFNEIIRCLDDTCHRISRVRDDGLQEATGFAVGPDGTVVYTRADPATIGITACPPTNRCVRGGYSLPAGAPRSGAVSTAVAVAPDGSIAIAALNLPRSTDGSDESASTPRTVQLTLTRCADAACTDPRTAEMPPALSSGLSIPTDGDDPFDPVVAGLIHIGIDAAGRPEILLRAEGIGILGLCTTPACENAQFSTVNIPGDEPLVTIDPVTDTVIAVADGALYRCRTDCATLSQFAAYQDPGEGALTTTSSGDLDILLYPTTETGQLLTIGTPPEPPRLLTLWHCTTSACDNPAITTLATVNASAKLKIAANTDGRIIIATPSRPGSALLYIC